MYPLSLSQASTKIKEARKKTSYLVACLFVLVGVLSLSPVQAHNLQNAEINKAYENIFGKRFVHKPHTHVKTKTAPKDIDLVAAYQQLFPQKKKLAIKQKSRVIPQQRMKNKVIVVEKPSPIQKEVVEKTPIVIPIKKVVKPRVEPTIENSSPSKVSNLDALFAKAFGKKATTAAPSQVTVDLRINKTVLGDVTVFSNKQGTIDRVGREAFLVLLKDVVKEHVYEKVVSQTAKKKKLSFITLSKLGIDANYNSVDLSLDLNINTALRKPLILSMQSKRGVSVRDINKITANKVSGFLNMYSSVGLNSGGAKPDISMKLEGSLNFGKGVFESTVDVRNGQFSIDKTKLTFDRPNKLQRFVLGDISTGVRNFQENLRLNGLRISKEFFMDSEMQIRPRANESFVLKTDSEVEVFINDQLRQRFHLREGIYSLEDIGLYDGANNIRVRIKDKFGKITEKTSQQFYASSLLKKDLSLYAISVGYLSNQQVGSNNNLIKDPILSGYYQKGLTKDLTMSIDAQISANAYLLGSEVITSIPLGIINSSVAISGGSDKKSGAAARFDFKPNKQVALDLLPSKNSFIKNWTMSGELRSRDFSLLNGSDSIDVSSGNKINKKLKARLQTNLGLDFGDKWRGTLNLSLSDYYDSGNNTSINLAASRRIRNTINLSVAARYDTDDDFSVILQLSLPLSNISKKRKVNFDLQANSRNNSFESKLSLRPHSLIGRNSLQGSLEYFQNDDTAQQTLNLGYRATNFETSFKAQNNLAKTNKQNSQSLNIGFNSSLACVGSRCAASHPIHDSFALVSGPSNQEAPIAINNGNQRFVYSDTNDTGLPDNYTALIPSKNRMAVLGLSSYRYQSINVDEGTLPNGYDTEKTEFEVFPRYRQGFIIKAGGEPATMLNGVLVNGENKPLGFKGGQWIQSNGKGKAIAFFSNKAGRFRITSIPAGKYKLELFDYPDMETINVNVPDLKGKVHDLGNIRIME